MSALHLTSLCAPCGLLKAGVVTPGVNRAAVRTLVVMTLSHSLSELRDPSRCLDLGGHRSFATPLLLSGWEQHSVWGFDQCHTQFFGCLWPDHQDKPVAVTDFDCGCPRGRSPGAIVLAVFDVIGADLLTIIDAMGLRDPAASLRPVEEITAQIDARRSREIAGDVIDGSVAALQWLLGDRRCAPGSCVSWPDGPVTATHADAERQLLSGLFYDHDRSHRQGFNCGAESALDWALGREGLL
jgi:hypothetical protein